MPDIAAEPRSCTHVMNTSALDNRRHEAFAIALAQGFAPPVAYLNAGFSSKNRQARSAQLARKPAVKARVEALRASFPHIGQLWEHTGLSCPPLPETQEDMIAWLWRVTHGSHKIVPYQLRAATLLCRLKGWNLTKPASPEAASNPPPPQEPEDDLFAAFQALQADIESSGATDPLTAACCVSIAELLMSSFPGSGAFPAANGATASPSQTVDTQKSAATSAPNGAKMTSPHFAAQPASGLLFPSQLHSTPGHSFVPLSSAT